LGNSKTTETEYEGRKSFMLAQDGKIKRVNKEVVVTVQGDASLAKIPGVVCENVRAHPSRRLYRKVFTKKPIYLPSEYEQAVREVLGGGQDIVVVGMNGYSRLTDAQCRNWGVKPGAYEAACKSILSSTILALQREFPGIDVRLAHGASDLGVDRMVIEVGRELNRPQLGHSCPHFMMWVEDDDIPVFVARDQAEYSDRFIESLHILIAANGRYQSFHHDIDAAFKMLRHVIPLNILRSISGTGGPPAIGPDGQIEDAVAAFEERVHLITQQMGYIRQDQDAWDHLITHIHKTTVRICRTLLTPERAFSVYSNSKK
jgi:hypothetical protein